MLRWDIVNGIININKPIGITSFGVVSRLKRILKMKKIGHTGTLDPLATGVLVICTGRGTKLASIIEGTKKTYIATFKLGAKTDTYDSEGEILEESSVKASREDILGKLDIFRGDIAQVPPMYSAIKVGGKKLYDLAREGVVIERKPRAVTIEKLELLEFNEETQEGKLYCEVSKGTYIRSLIFDLGEELKTYGHMIGLERTVVGKYKVEDSYTLEEVEELMEKDDKSFLTPVEEIFDFPKLELKEDKNIKLYLNGNTVVYNGENGRYKIYKEDEFIGYGEIIDNRLKGWKIF